MSIRLMSLVLFITAFVSTAVIAEDAPKIISVQGSASIAAVPDAFSVTFLIEERGETVSKLNQTVTHSTRSIIKFLKSMNVEERYIETMQIQLDPWFEGYQKERQQMGFVLRRTIRVSHSELEQYDALIDGVLKNGANRIEQFSFVVRNQEALYLQALSAAVADAKMKAERMLQPLDAKLGSVVSVNELQGFAQPRARMMMADSEGSTALPGVQGVDATISVSFLIE